jgi:hypothetical protein
MSLTIETSEGPVAFDSTEPVPGLHVYEIPADANANSPLRWVLSHHEGRSLGWFKSSDAATRAAESVASLADWTRNAMTVAQVISFGGNTVLLMALLAEHGANDPNA